MNRTPKKNKPFVPALSKSKYEFNLAEWPLVFLSQKIPKDGLPKVINYEDSITGKGGKEITRKWKISPSVEYGWGSPEVLGLNFELIQIWKEQGFDSPDIRFHNIANLIRRRGINPDDTKNYHRCRRDLNALVGLTYEAKNAFYDKELDAYVDATGHFYDYVYFYHREESSRQEPLPLAYIRASERLWGSVESNALLTIDLPRELFHTFTPMEQKVGLFLAKMLHEYPMYRRFVREFAQQIPIKAQRYSHTKEQLTKTVEGLIEKKFPHLGGYSYEGKPGSENEKIVFYRPTKNQDTDNSSPVAFTATIPPVMDPMALDLVTRIGEATKQPEYASHYQTWIRDLGKSAVEAQLSDARAKVREGLNQKSVSHVLVDNIKREYDRQGVERKWGSDRSAEPPL